MHCSWISALSCLVVSVHSSPVVPGPVVSAHPNLLVESLVVSAIPRPGGRTAIGCTSCNGSSHLMCLGRTHTCTAPLVAAYATFPPEGAMSACEHSSCLVTANETVTDLSACLDMAKNVRIAFELCAWRSSLSFLPALTQPQRLYMNFPSGLT